MEGGEVDISSNELSGVLYLCVYDDLHIFFEAILVYEVVGHADSEWPHWVVVADIVEANIRVVKITHFFGHSYINLSK